MNTTKKKRILIIALCVFIIGAIVSLIGVIDTLVQYSRSKAEYDQIKRYVNVQSSHTIPTGARKTEAPQKTSKPDAAEEETEEPAPSVIDVKLDMDIASLKSLNSDFMGWILYEPLQINYPLVLDKGDNYYEVYSFEGAKNVGGAIFADYLCRKDLNSFNTIIYGHSMRNGTMFGQLNKLMTDETIIKNNPNFYIFTEDEALMFKIVAAYYTPDNSQTYDLKFEYSLEDKKEYIKYIDSVAKYKDEEFFTMDITDDTKICTLSTCHGHNTGQRTVVHGLLVAREPRNGR